METLHNGKSFQPLERSCSFAHTDVAWKNPLSKKGICLLLLSLFLKYSVLSQLVSLTDKVKFGLNLCILLNVGTNSFMSDVDRFLANPKFEPVSLLYPSDVTYPMTIALMR